MANCLILIAAVNADTYTLPSPLFADCITILPIAVIEYCNPVGIPIRRSSCAASFLMWRSSFPSHISSIFREITIRQQIPLMACAVMVAMAAPAHPHFSTTMQNRSKKIFSTAANARKINGVLLSPTDLRILDR